MVTPELVKYIRAQLKNSVPLETIHDNLLKNGWFKEDIDEAFTVLHEEINVNTVPEVIPSVKEKSNIFLWTVIGIAAFIALSIFIPKVFTSAGTLVTFVTLPALPYIVALFSGASIALKTHIYLGHKYAHTWQKVVLSVAIYYIAEFLIRKLALFLAYPFLATTGGWVTIAGQIVGLLPLILIHVLAIAIGIRVWNRSKKEHFVMTEQSQRSSVFYIFLLFISLIIGTFLQIGLLILDMLEYAALMKSISPL